MFRIIKFRSMRQDAEKNGAVWAKINDDRATRVGEIIQRLRIDDLKVAVEMENVRYSE